MIQYVLGFMLDEGLEVVALIRKLKPPALASLLNGIGGKIEYGESAQQAMIREFREETGVDHNFWLYAGKATFQSTGEEMFVYTTNTNKVFGVETVEAEEVSVHTVDEVKNGKLKLGPNVKSLLTMSMACFFHTKRVPFEVQLP